MTEDAPHLDEWGDLRVGDEVRQVGPPGVRLDTFIIVEIRPTPQTLGPNPMDAVALIRDAWDEIHFVNVRQLVRA